MGAFLGGRGWMFDGGLWVRVAAVGWGKRELSEKRDGLGVVDRRCE